MKTKIGVKQTKTTTPFKPEMSSLLKFTGISPKLTKITNNTRKGK